MPRLTTTSTISRRFTVVAVLVVTIGACVIDSTVVAFMPLSSLSASPSSPSTSTSTTRLQYTNSKSSSSSSSSSSHSDHERFRQAIAAAAAAKSMYYHNEMTVAELNQVRASFELLLQRNHLYSSTGQTILSSSSSSTAQAGLEVYYPEGVIHPASSGVTSSSNHYHPSTTTSPDQTHHDAWRTAEREMDVTDDDDDTNQHLVLTTSGRRLRELEIQLLESIRMNDDGIDQLVHLWTTERTAASAHALLQMQNSNQICSDGLVQEEADLAELCRSYPGWAEPWSRLATLLFYKGVHRWSDALSAAEEAIRIKPWHFEALNVCTLILAQMDHPDNPSVIFGDDESVDDLRRRCYRLSRLALPKLNNNGGDSSSTTSMKNDLEARQIWVSRAVATAQHQLQCAEQHTAASYQQQQYTMMMMTTTTTNNNEEVLSAWQ